MEKPNVEKVSLLKGHKNAVYTVTSGRLEHTFLSAAGDGLIVEWDLESLGNQPVTLANAHTQVFSALLISKSILVVGQMKGGLHILDLAQGKEVRHLAVHKLPIFDIKSDPNNNRLLVASGDGILSAFNLETLDLEKQVRLSDSSLRSISLNHDNTRICTGCSDHHFYIIDAVSLELEHKFKGHENSIFSTCFSPDSRYLLTGSRDAHLKAWSLEDNYKEIWSVPAHLYTINDVKFSPDGRWFASAGRDKHIKIWNSASFDLLRVIDIEKYGGHFNSVNKLFWTNYKHYLVSCSDDRSIIIWKIT